MRRYESITGKKGGSNGAMAKEDVVKLVTELQALSSSTRTLKTVLYVALALLILLMGATAGLVYSVVKLNQDTDVASNGLLVSSSDNSVPIRGGRSRFNLTGVDPLPAKTPEAAAAYLESRYAKTIINATVTYSYILDAPQLQMLPSVGTSLLYRFTIPNDEQIDALCHAAMVEGQDRVLLNFTGNNAGSPYPVNPMFSGMESSYILSYAVDAQYGCSEVLADSAYKKDHMVTFVLSGAPGIAVMMFCEGDYCDMMDMKTQEEAKATVAAISAIFGPNSGKGRRLMEANDAAGRYFDMLAFFE